MSSHPLPDDPARWPRDPYQILGVAAGVLPTELRRAYTRLIRQYKPEQFPEQFRRIREAYDTIQQHTEFVGYVPASAPPEPPVPTEDDVLAAPPDQAELLHPPTPVPEITGPPPWQTPPPSLQEELHEVWEQAVSTPDAAYGRLQEIRERHPNQVDVYLRLYWLLALAPELDAARSPCHWLVQGLGATSWEGPLRELYRREILADPAEALTARCTALLQHPPRPALLLELLGWRWPAAQRLGEWAVICGDVEALRDQLRREGDEVWARLLLRAIDHLVWAPADRWQPAVTAYRDEIERLDHLQSRLESEVDRLEFLLALADQWYKLRRLRSVPAALRELVPLSWNRPLAEFRRPLMEVLGMIARHPQSGLDFLDAVHHHASTVLAQFGQMLSSLQNELGPLTDHERTEEEARRRVLEFLDTHRPTQYTALRPQLLAFCLREGISPETLAQLVDDQPANRLSAQQFVSPQLLGDWSLRYVWLAHRLFWA